MAFKDFSNAVLRQEGVVPTDVYIVDSSSQDDTVELAIAAGFNVQVISVSEFSHGGTRAMLVEQIYADIIVFLTQDAVLADEHAVKNLISCFQDEIIAAAYGRQKPNERTSGFGAFARQFNYGDKSFVNVYDDRIPKGIKTAFLSDSFSAYRRKYLLAIGNFDRNLTYGEDTIAAATLLKAGYKTAYCAEAKAYHAHSFTIAEEFHRYKDTGRFHKQQRWFLDEFGKAEGEGLRFVRSEILYLIRQGKWYLVPEAFIRNFAKFAGYKFGMWL